MPFFIEPHATPPMPHNPESYCMTTMTHTTIRVPDCPKIHPQDYPQVPKTQSAYIIIHWPLQLLNNKNIALIIEQD